MCGGCIRIRFVFRLSCYWWRQMLRSFDRSRSLFFIFCYILQIYYYYCFSCCLSAPIGCYGYDHLFREIRLVSLFFIYCIFSLSLYLFVSSAGVDEVEKMENVDWWESIMFVFCEWLCVCVLRMRWVRLCARVGSKWCLCLETSGTWHVLSFGTTIMVLFF